MSPEEADRIFEHFYSTKPGGSGLGLSIVRRLVTDLHGSVRVETAPGKGTSMIVEIPAASRAAGQPDTQSPSKRLAGGRR
jgi:signal transduction histidine kinase